MSPTPAVPLDEFRLGVLRRDSGLASVKKSWPHWRPHLLAAVGEKPDTSSVWALGEALREAFTAVPKAGRSQGELSRSGTAFEYLLCWYLNLIFWGTEVVVARGNGKNSPSSLQDAVAVRMGTTMSKSETDLLAFSVPGGMDWNRGRLNSLTRVNERVSKNFKGVTVVILQSKTNWADNAQVPMLWDLIYDVERFASKNVEVGVGGFTPRSLKKFRYAFATVPTGKPLETRKASGVNVKRVQQLSGHNFWCAKTIPDVALCINEFPGVNFQEEIVLTDAGHLPGHVQQNLNEEPDLVAAFLDLDF